jgi:ribonuclease P/MRP protein subunit POP5
MRKKRKSAARCVYYLKAIKLFNKMNLIIIFIIIYFRHMVKFKSRYLLAELQYEHDASKVKQYDSNQLYAFITKQIKMFFGDVGIGKTKKNFQVKYHNNFTNVVIMRVSKEHIDILWTTLTLVTQIDNEPLRIKIIKVSGTIKKAEAFLAEHLKTWVNNYEKTKGLKEIK